jgi:rubrerythrin
MENEIAVGKNRTGAQMAPLGTTDVKTFAESRLGAGSRDGARYAEVHREYIREADRIGSVPAPATVKGMAATMVSAVKGDKASVFIDKLGERAAFERTGVRLYEALLIKCSALGADDTPFDIEMLQTQLKEMRDDEESHFALVTEAIKTIGGDPTAMTPCADVAGVIATGWLQALTDPRTTLAQALNTMLAVELADRAGWDLLVELAQATGHKELAQSFTAADATEQQHLERMNALLREAVLNEAT